MPASLISDAIRIYSDKLLSPKFATITKGLDLALMRSNCSRATISLSTPTEMPVAGTSSFPNLDISLSYLPPPATDPKTIVSPFVFFTSINNSASKIMPV